MIEILPIKLLTDEDSQIFGSLNVALGKLGRAEVNIGSGIVVTPPNLRLKTTLEHFDFGSREVFEQSLTLVKKEINSTPLPDILMRETRKQKQFLLNGEFIQSTKDLWLSLLNTWLGQIKERLWKEGLHQGITEGLEPQLVIFADNTRAWGSAYFDSLQDDTVINIKKGQLHPADLRILDELVRLANKKLFIPHEYEWVLDKRIKLTKVLPYTPEPLPTQARPGEAKRVASSRARSAVKIFFDLSSGFTFEKEVDGIFIASEKIFDLENPNESFENLVFRLVESATSFPKSPVLLKLADQSEQAGMGKVRGTLRLLHQKSLFDPLADALIFARHKKGLQNISVVVPFIRGVNEFLQIKRNLAVKKLIRKKSLSLWMEVAIPENIINLKDYLTAGLDGIVLNLDELVSYLNGFDTAQGELAPYKNEVSGLIQFLEDGLRLLHKSKIPFIAYGNLSLYPEVLEFLVEKGVYGIVVERYEAHSVHELLHQAERRLILRRTS